MKIRIYYPFVTHDKTMFYHISLKLNHYHEKQEIKSSTLYAIMRHKVSATPTPSS